MCSTEELEFILYNNRSVKGVVANFLPNINPLEIIDIENKLDTIKSNYKDDRCVVIEKHVEDCWDTILNVGQGGRRRKDDFEQAMNIDGMSDYFFVDDNILHIFTANLAQDLSKATNIDVDVCFEQINERLNKLFTHWEIDFTNDEFVVWLN